MNTNKFSCAAVLVLIVLGVSWTSSFPSHAPVQLQFQVVHAFVENSMQDADGPQGRLVLDSKGNIYGASNGGGTYLGGTVYELAPESNGQWTETIIHSFPASPTDGARPVNVVMDAGGNLYGATTAGGANDHGMVFELSPVGNGQWSESILYSFCSLPGCADGGNTVAGPILGPSGALYGVTTASPGTVYELTPGQNGWTFNLLYTFCSLPNCADGVGPYGTLALDAKGNLYGASGGASSNCGLVGCGQEYILQPQANGQWKESVLYVFQGGSNGSGPEGATLHHGNLYSATQSGGSFCFGGCGTIFELSRAGNTVNEQILYDFGASSAQGVVPLAGVTFNSRGDMFGVTADGGSTSCGCGTTYGMRQQPNGQWVHQVLHSFSGTDGYMPDSTPALDSHANLFGTTGGGGTGDGGVLYEISAVE